LYGLDALAERIDEPVIIAEGERTADAAGKLLTTMVPISWPHGANNAANVDWSAMSGRDCWVWPDADGAGAAAAREVYQQCRRAGATSVRIMPLPIGVPDGWDAADALAEGRPVREIAALVEKADEVTIVTPYPSAEVVILKDWTADRFGGPPPERQWLVQGILPLAVPAMAAAYGGVGKSMLTIRLGLEIATGDLRESGSGGPPRILGGSVMCHGTAVLITAEDDASEVHRRLAALDPQQLRLQHPERLIVVPLPNAGGILTLLQGGFDSPSVTEEYQALHRQLIALPNLRLVVFDPLQAFVGADTNKDPAAAQHLCTLLGRLAAETGATVLITHHFRKHGKTQSRSMTPADAREAVRGSTALIDGVRSVYALWPAEPGFARKVCAELGTPYEPNKVVRGAVVKCNWPVDLRIHVYVRDEFGLLCDCTDQLGTLSENLDLLLSELEDAIGHAANDGKPYTKTGRSGVYERRDELPRPLRKIGRNRLQNMVQELLNADRARQCSVGKSGSVKWLDLPDGPFDRGEGEFAPGGLKGGSN
jgi:hypothetical protein